MAINNVIALQSEKTTIEVQTQVGQPWQVVTGAASISVSGGDASSREVRDLQDNPITIIGRPSVPTISVPINLYNPHTKVHRELKQAKDNSRNILVRWQTEPVTIRSYSGSGNTFAISDTGQVTFAGTNRPDVTADYFGLGLVIKDGSTEYVVDEYVDANTIRVVNSDFSAVTTAVAATEDYSLIKPAVRRPQFEARIINFDVEDIGEQSQMSTTLDLQPENALPNWEILVGN